MGKRPKWRKLYNVLCVLKALAYTNVATCRETNMFEVWVSYSGRMGSSHLCGKKMVPQSTSSFKRALNKTEMYPPASLSTWRWSVFHFLNITPVCTRPSSEMLRPFQRLLAFWRKCPLCRLFMLMGGFFPYPPSFHLLRGSRRTGELRERGTFVTQLPVSCMARSVLVPGKSQADICT